MKPTARLVGLDKAAEVELRFIEGAITGAMGEAVLGLKDDLRDQVQRAGLGGRLAKTWRSEVYPKGEKSLSPGGYVWSKAPEIIVSFATGATIASRSGRFLAIPTDAVPQTRGRGMRRRMSPEEVELAFNQDLELQRGKGGNILAFVHVVRARSARRGGFRQATRRRLAQGRELERVLMFTFVPRVKMPHLLDLGAAAAKWGARVVTLFDERMGH